MQCVAVGRLRCRLLLLVRLLLLLMLKEEEFVCEYYALRTREQILQHLQRVAHDVIRHVIEGRETLCSGDSGGRERRSRRSSCTGGGCNSSGGCSIRRICGCCCCCWQLWPDDAELFCV